MLPPRPIESFFKQLTNVPKSPTGFAPATTAAATAAISAAAPAAATAPTTTAAAKSAATTTAARGRTCLIDGEPPAIELGVVELLDRRTRGVFRFHFDEGKSTRAARGLIAHHADG